MTLTKESLDLVKKFEAMPSTIEKEKIRQRFLECKNSAFEFYCECSRYIDENEVPA